MVKPILWDIRQPRCYDWHRDILLHKKGKKITGAASQYHDRSSRSAALSGFIYGYFKNSRNSMPAIKRGPKKRRGKRAEIMNERTLYSLPIEQ